MKEDKGCEEMTIFAVLTRALLATAIASALLLASFTEVLASDLVVVDARGIDLKPGAKIPSNAVVKLEAGVRLTLVTANGETIRLRGPFEDLPVRDVNNTQGVVESLRKMMVAPTSGTLTPGVVRSAGELTELPNPWVIDVSRSGTRCIREGEPIVLWRPTKSASAEPISITPSDRGWEAKGNWPIDVDTVTMPAKLPLTNGATFKIEVGQVEHPLMFQVLPAALENDKMRVAWMDEVGCNSQAMALVKSLAP
jgi:hypothetical protein